MERSCLGLAYSMLMVVALASCRQSDVFGSNDAKLQQEVDRGGPCA